MQKNEKNVCSSTSDKEKGVMARKRRGGYKKAGVNRAYDATYTVEEAMKLPIRVKKAEAARLLGMHEDTVCKKARAGKIPGAVFESGTWYFSTRLLLAHIDGEV